MSTHLRTGAQNLPALLTCRDVLEFATVEGVRCTGLETAEPLSRRLGSPLPR